MLAFTEVFTRVVIFPSRTVQGIKDKHKRREAEIRRARINIAALKTLMTLRREGRLVLVFPSGTRYRSWDPSTGRGLKEIDTYIKYYSHMVLVAINGNTLLPNPNGNMDEDYPVKDVVRYTVSPVLQVLGVPQGGPAVAARRRRHQAGGRRPGHGRPGSPARRGREGPTRVNPARPRPVAELPAELCRRLAFLFTDIDDTLTRDGMLPAGSYAALWDLHDAGIRVVPVTGRPAGWCDHIARMWPVDGVVGENGAFYYRYDRIGRRMTRSYTLPPAELAAGRKRLAAIASPGAPRGAGHRDRRGPAVPHLGLRHRLPRGRAAAAPGFGRRHLADPGGRGRHAQGLEHPRQLLDRRLRQAVLRETVPGGAVRLPSFEAAAERAVFVGDSPNDEPLFAGFPHTIAVANIRAYLDRLAHLPEYVTAADAADGFVEAVKIILTQRGG